MKNSIKSLIVGSSILAASPSFAGVCVEIAPECAPPESSGVAFDVSGGYHTIYEFRGAHLGDDLFDAGLNISGDIGNGFTLSGGLWYGYTLDGPGSNTYNELDLFTSLSRSFGFVDVSVGYTYYSYPSNESDGTNEFNVALSSEIGYGISIGAMYAYDIDIEGGYLEFETAKGFALSDQVGLNFSGGVSFSFEYNPERASRGDGKLDGFNHWFVKAEMPWAITEDFTLTPYVKYINVASDFATEFDTGASDDHFFGGVSLSYSF